ncbi:hypothetical protein D187_002939 [Cystobacter fuscus DSM 2262]|uniref:Uncharacterized protein n=1 Tax=Cystobacter fuscus (strain ATCC 25194 / DSM 2262 / NBRC 100088 / M29) TaxID=1242864 RepID=S9QDM2_CYSF2|nr:hypothetical protein D187_002939 [Cystobacter fuscus DSM 2262]
MVSTPDMRHSGHEGGSEMRMRLNARSTAAGPKQVETTK